MTRTLSDGYFAIGDLPPGRVNIVDSHLAFQAFIPGMGARIDLGRLKYPLIHPPTYYYLAPDPLPNLSTLLDKGQSIDFAVCLTDPDWQRPSEPAQRDRVWSKPPFRDALADWLQWWFKQPAVLYDTTDRFVQSFPDGPNLDRLADDWRYLLGLWTGASVVDGSHCAYDDQTLEDLLARRQLEVWLLGYQAVRVRQLGNHFGVQVVAAPGYQVIRFPGVEAAIAVHLIENGREILQLPQNPPQQWTGAQ